MKLFVTLLFCLSFSAESKPLTIHNAEDVRVRDINVRYEAPYYHGEDICYNHVEERVHTSSAGSLFDLDLPYEKKIGSCWYKLKSVAIYFRNIRTDDTSPFYFFYNDSNHESIPGTNLELVCQKKEYGQENDYALQLGCRYDGKYGLRVGPDFIFPDEITLSLLPQIVNEAAPEFLVSKFVSGKKEVKFYQNKVSLVSGNSPVRFKGIKELQGKEFNIRFHLKRKTNTPIPHHFWFESSDKTIKGFGGTISNDQHTSPEILKLCGKRAKLGMEVTFDGEIKKTLCFQDQL